MSWAEGRRRRPEPQEGPRGASKALKKSLSVLRSHWRELIRREILLDLYLGSSLWLLRGGWGAAARARQEETEEGHHGLPGWGEVVALDLGCGHGL